LREERKRKKEDTHIWKMTYFLLSPFFFIFELLLRKERKRGRRKTISSISRPRDSSLSLAQPPRAVGKGRGSFPPAARSEPLAKLVITY